MKIGIISDTHDQIQRVEKAISALNAEKVKLVYLLGDICSPFTLQMFRGLDCPVRAVFGNNDADIYKDMQFKPENVEFKDRYFEDKVDGLSIAMLHGDLEGAADALFESGRFDLVLRGHNHKAEIRKSRKTMLINPGSLIGPIALFPKWTKPSVAIFDTRKKEARILSI